MINLSNTNISHSFYPRIDLTGIRLGVGSKAGGVPSEPVFDPSSFDQAWTVTGKTNEDSDRASVTNLTGNGNDLVLSNFLFAENSGYGLYKFNFNLFGSNGGTKSSIDSIMTFSAPANNNTSNVYSPLYEVGYMFDFNVHIEGLEPGITAAFLILGTDQKVDIPTNGIYNIKLTVKEGATQNRLYIMFYNTLDKAVPVRIIQIPDYEGYLVTDGVDDKIVSSAFDMGKDWTIVGDWKFLTSDVNTNCGFSKPSSFYIYNQAAGALVYVNRSYKPVTIPDARSIKAVCSDGRIYLDDWTEVIDETLQMVESSNGIIYVANYGSSYTQMAFKNLGIYNGKVLTKNQCIAAYNYLQTLKHQ